MLREPGPRPAREAVSGHGPTSAFAPPQRPRKLNGRFENLEDVLLSFILVHRASGGFDPCFLLVLEMLTSLSF